MGSTSVSSARSPCFWSGRVFFVEFFRGRNPSLFFPILCGLPFGDTCVWTSFETSPWVAVCVVAGSGRGMCCVCAAVGCVDNCWATEAYDVRAWGAAGGACGSRGAAGACHRILVNVVLKKYLAYFGVPLFSSHVKWGSSIITCRVFILYIDNDYLANI